MTDHELLSARTRPAALTAFYRRQAAVVAFDYQVGEESIVAQLSVGDATFWVADESPPHANFSPESLGGGTVRLLLIVEDPDASIPARGRRPARAGRGRLPDDRERARVLGGCRAPARQPRPRRAPEGTAMTLIPELERELSAMTARRSRGRRRRWLFAGVPVALAVTGTAALAATGVIRHRVARERAR